MKILKILGIAAGLHAFALILIFANPGCSYTKAAGPDASPISSAPAGDASSPSASPAAVAPASDSATIRYSPTRPGTTVASALETQPVSDVTPATTYIVVKGDNLWGIAKKNELTKAELAAANNLKVTSVLRVGQKLIIPSKLPVPAAAAATPTAMSGAPAPSAAGAPTLADKPAVETLKHVVKPGETLGGIARRYGVKQGEIAVLNNITDPRKIQPGQELSIPNKSASTASKSAKTTKAKADASPAAAGAQTAASDQDLDAGLKPPTATDVPVVKIEDGAGAQPKNP